MPRSVPRASWADEMTTALVIGGTGPTGPGIVGGLIARGYRVDVLHRGVHEVPLPEEVGHIHADPHFDTMVEALAGRTYEVVVATYGRARLLPKALRGVTERLISIGGATYAHRDAASATEESERVTTTSLFAKVLETENELFLAHERGDFALTHLRFPAIYGPREVAPTDWSIIRRIRDGRPRIPAVEGGLMLRTRAFADNAAHAVIEAVVNDAAIGQVYNATDSFTLSDADRIRGYASLLGAEVEIVSVPAIVRIPPYYPGTTRGMRLSESGYVRGSHELISNAKIRRQLGYRDVAGFDAALEHTLNWYTTHAPQPEGEEETRLGDPFNYAREDAFLDSLGDAVARVDGSMLGETAWRHPYDHPDTQTPQLEKGRE